MATYHSPTMNGFELYREIKKIIGNNEQNDDIKVELVLRK
jgi:hypothetical protein